MPRKERQKKEKDRKKDGQKEKQNITNRKKVRLVRKKDT